MSTRTSTSFSLGQKVFLAAIVPLTLLVMIEGLCRLLNTPALLNRQELPQNLEMPAWLARDQNRERQVVKISTDQNTLEWMKLFEEGDGYRLHLIPHITSDVINTFSLLDYDKQARFRIEANSIGFRGPELAMPKPIGTFRILVFGDSSSFGWGVNQSDRFDTLLAQILSDSSASTKIEIGNFAIPGDSSEYGRLVVEKFAKQYAPDLIILGFGANDAKFVYRSHTSQVERFRSQLWLRNMLHSLSGSYIFRTMEELLASRRSEEAEDSAPRTLAVSKPRYRENLADMMSEAGAAGVKKSLILSLCSPNDYAKQARQVAHNHRGLFFNGQSFLKKLIPDIKGGLLHPDYVKEMRSLYGADLKRNDLFYISSDGCHPNKLGHRLIAEKLAAIISSAGLP